MSGSVIDFSEIEDVKENVQPLRAGRNPKDLAKQVKGLKSQPLTNTVSVIAAQNISRHEASRGIRSGQLLFQGSCKRVALSADQVGT